MLVQFCGCVPEGGRDKVTGKGVIHHTPLPTSQPSPALEGSSLAPSLPFPFGSHTVLVNKVIWAAATATANTWSDSRAGRGQHGDGDSSTQGRSPPLLPPISIIDYRFFYTDHYSKSIRPYSTTPALPFRCWCRSGVTRISNFAALYSCDIGGSVLFRLRARTPIFVTVQPHQSPC